MLIGEYNHTIDTKGRVIIPVKFRTELGERFILTKGFDGCLYGYSLEEWKGIEEKIKTVIMRILEQHGYPSRYQEIISTLLKCCKDSIKGNANE